MSRRKSSRKYISAESFADLRKEAAMTRREAAKALDVTPRTIQNWETGNARIPWMAYRMLRVLRGYALPGVEWEGWTVRGRNLFAPNGRPFDAVLLQNIELVFGQARLFRKMYSATHIQKPPSVVLPFPDLHRQVEVVHRPLAAQPKQIGGQR